MTLCFCLLYLCSWGYIIICIVFVLAALNIISLILWEYMYPDISGGIEVVFRAENHNIPQLGKIERKLLMIKSRIHGINFCQTV